LRLVISISASASDEYFLFQLLLFELPRVFPPVNGNLWHEKPCAIISTTEQQELIDKIKRLPQDRVAEVEDFVDSLARREHISNRENLHQALTDYATQHAGTEADIDPDLEAAASDHLLQQATEQ
jgi:hypothetical protein